MMVSTRQRHAFSLVEVTLALGVASFCLLSVFALFPAGVALNQISLQQTADATLARGIAMDLSVTPKSVPPTTQTSPRYGIPIPVTGTASHTLFLKDDGTISGAIDTDAVASLDPRYRATITFTAPSSASYKTAIGVRVLITWPALADKSAGTAPSKYLGAYEVQTALNRN
jgi:type II secretory pathway pseudopilin PulG